MANSKHLIVQILVVALFCALALLQDSTGSRAPMELHNLPTGYSVSSPETEIRLKNGSMRNKTKSSLIGSVTPFCTYNECRGCMFKCRAEQVPVDGNDPMNSHYHYKCVCHR